ncbi:hypothetical protein MUG84_10705 [Paenibacillus sp. KQZ6P-2]|uniref:Glycoside hydrolase family 38 N-terminal domain-containing protein n=1 Tax=Paenibacillus mangrovi TaxID=2931978 RepID=A0A9X1WPC8_9BACL|nr:hypothetical protein [Paenibacillus mangrovi]MCJ8012206.1 hypothetical protein [Paenibacillus mangrovi]
MRDHDSESELEWSNLEEVIVVCKTHFDIGYTHRVKEFVHYIRTSMIDKAMDIMDQGKETPPEQQFAWTSPSWVMSRVLDDWEGQTPERQKRLDDYVKSGRFKFHALPFTLESDACEPEEIARGLTFASNLSRKYSMPLPTSSKMTDVPSHGGALATVLANSGVKFIHIGCNWPSGYVTTPGLFWWEGPDGSRILPAPTELPPGLIGLKSGGRGSLTLATTLSPLKVGHTKSGLLFLSPWTTPDPRLPKT